MACFKMAFTTNELLGYIHESMTAEYPDCLAFLVVRQLLDDFMPQDKMSRVELRRRLNAIKMKPNENPKRLFEQISTVQNAFNGPNQRVDEDDLMVRARIHILGGKLHIIFCKK